MRTSLRSRLYLICLGLILLLSVPTFYSLGKLNDLRDIAFDLRSRHAAAYLAVGRLQTAVSELNRLERSYVVAPDAETRQELFDVLEQGRGQLESLATSGYSDVAAPVEATFDSLESSLRLVDAHLQEGDVEEATRLFQAGKVHFADLQDGLGQVAEEIDRRSFLAATRAQQISESAGRNGALAFVGFLVVALAIGVVGVGTLTSPLRHLREAMATVAGGDLEAPESLPYGREDEVGDLSRSFRSMTTRLAELDRLKAEFVSMASHELKTPVSVIRGYAEMMGDGFYGPVNDKQRRVLGYVDEQTSVLNERVNQLLALSRFEARGIELIPLRVRLAEFVAELEETYRALASQREVRFEVIHEPTAPETVWLDPDRVRNELLGNLLGNAFKFTGDGGSIQLRVRGRRTGGESRVVFEVRDSGEGIPADQLPYVFEKYYQAGPNAGKVGTGLGLAIVREIVHGHGGEIHVRSEPGEGAVFTVELPVRPPAGDVGAVSTEIGPGRRAARTGPGSRGSGEREPDPVADAAAGAARPSV